jgi:hypothetical protein
MHFHAERGNDQTLNNVGASLLAKNDDAVLLIIPMLCVEMPPGTLRVPLPT